VTEVTAVDDLAMNGSLNWTPDSAALILASNTGREFTGVARYNVASGRWTWLITDDSADLAGWLSPDGSLLLVERNDDGAFVLSLHDAGTGKPPPASPARTSRARPGSARSVSASFPAPPISATRPRA
jgi:hypothetical protein